MITGIHNTGEVIRQQLLQTPDQLDNEIYSHYPTNGVGPAKSTGNITVYPYMGGPLIKMLDNGHANARLISHNGYNMNVSPGYIQPVNTVPADTTKVVKESFISSVISSLFSGFK